MGMTAIEARNRLNHTDAYAAQIDGAKLGIRLMHSSLRWSVITEGRQVDKSYRAVELPIVDGEVDAGYVCYLLSAVD